MAISQVVTIWYWKWPTYMVRRAFNLGSSYMKSYPWPCDDQLWEGNICFDFSTRVADAAGFALTHLINVDSFSCSLGVCLPLKAARPFGKNLAWSSFQISLSHSKPPIFPDVLRLEENHILHIESVQPVPGSWPSGRSLAVAMYYYD